MSQSQIQQEATNRKKEVHQLMFIPRLRNLIDALLLEKIRHIRADQNTGGALLGFPMRTAMHGKSRASSAISVCDNFPNFNNDFSTDAVAQ